MRIKHRKGRHKCKLYWKYNIQPESRSLHPDNENSTTHGQFVVRIAKSLFVIHGVAHCNLNILNSGMLILKLDEVKSPRQQHRCRTFRFFKDSWMLLRKQSEIACNRENRYNLRGI